MKNRVTSELWQESLHYYWLAIVNKLHDELKKSFPRVDDCPKSLFIIKKDNWGQCFKGNECSRLLEHLSMLQNKL